MGAPVTIELDSEAAKVSFVEWAESVRSRREADLTDRLGKVTYRASDHIERFTEWMTLGTAAVASIWIIEAEQVISLLSPPGYLFAGAILIVSFLCGFYARWQGQLVRIKFELHEAAYNTTEQEDAAAAKTMGTIDEGNQLYGLSVSGEPMYEVVTENFLKLLPPVTRWLVRRTERRLEGKSIGHQVLLNVNKQANYSGLQGLTFALFFVVSCIFVAMNYLSD